MSLGLPTLGADNIVRGASLDVSPYLQQTLAEFLFDKLKAHGSSILLVDAITGKEVSAEDILQEAVTVAEVLRAYGVRPGDSVGISSENRHEYAASILAIIAVGATIAPLNFIYSHGEFKHTMGISQPSIVFCSPTTFATLLDVKTDLPFLKTLILYGSDKTDGSVIGYNTLFKNPGNPTTFQPTKVDVFNQVAVLLCSSGTTGLPKCVELTHFNMQVVFHGFREVVIPVGGKDEVIIGIMPFFHGYGFATLLAALAGNVKIVIMSGYKEALFLQTIQDYKVTRLFLVPPLAIFLAKHPIVLQYDLSSVRDIICGAAPLSMDVQAAVQKRLKAKTFAQAYGMTELTIACVFVPTWINKLGSSGVVCEGMEFKVVDIETGKALPSGKEGELCFKGPYVMKGYHNNIKATEETIDKEGWLHTGDIGYYDHEGFIFIVDRLKELIKYKGYQVAPAELEALLLTNPAVKDAAVIGIPDDDAGEKPLAIIVRQPGRNITADEIQKFVAAKVSPQKRLSGGVRFMEAIPKNPSGKILRRKLRELYKSKSTHAKL